MSQKVIEKVSATFRQTVRAQVAKGNHSQWREGDSLAVIEEMVGLLTSDEEVGAEGFDAIRDQMKRVVNPSAFAQSLEGLPDGSGKNKDGEADGSVDPESGKFVATPAHPSWIRRAEKGKRAGKSLDV